MDQTRSTWKRFSVGIAVAVSLTTNVYAASVNTIFAAENSLYGRGYDIGQADGWLDGDLRAAIKRFQSGTKGLKATSNLDPDTLKALGIAYEGATVSDNALATPNAALNALGLTPSHGYSAVPATIWASAPEPKPRPKPEPAPQALASAKPEPAHSTVIAKPEPRNATGTAPKPDRKPTVTRSAPARPAQPPAAEPQPAPPVMDTPVVAAASSDTGSAEPAPVPEAKPTKPFSDPVATEVAKEQSAPATTLSVEAPTTHETSPALAPASAPEADVAKTGVNEQKPQKTGARGGDFFSSLFDFLFGWIV
ncbi:peptidoglycan-binding domain-containing protein [Marinobacter caseinilyticus]|uniref:peptidoglycan-binding domain-containing protein n=1 Tax=Marinobacter caseinilyticus TaxID=2692195 RepID=UPI001408E165|nr:peptidoglycan-binding domain-containing protein [Marinobacter caseinilyticus]